MLVLILGLICVGSEPVVGDFEVIRKQYEEKVEAWEHRHMGPPGAPVDQAKVDWVARHGEWPGWEFGPLMLALAEAHPDEPDAASALFWVVDLAASVGDVDAGLHPVIARAEELIGRSYIDDSRIDTLCRRLSVSGWSSSSLEFLKQVSTKSKDEGVRGRATLAVAKALAGRAEVARAPWFAKPPEDAFHAYLIPKLSPSYVSEIEKSDPKALVAEAERWFERAARDFGKFPADMRNPKGPTITAVAEAQLLKLRNPPVEAPRP